jgi:hypothetical protein
VNTRPKAVLTIEDAESEGCVNIHYAFEPGLIEGSPSHHLMARILQDLQTLIGQEMKENLCALQESPPPSDSPAT